MLQINETFNVKSQFPCQREARYETVLEHDPEWRKTIVGCFVLHLLQDIYKFNITYLVNEYTNVTRSGQQEAIYPGNNVSVDIYVKPTDLQCPNLLDTAYPIQAILTWRFGFILRREHKSMLKAFYSQPFTSSVWICIYTTILLSALVFYILSLWDRRLNSTLECSFGHELLLAFSAFCQHILPLQAESCSRRIAYLTFIMCAYVVHCFYTSNLLSHLVNDADVVMDLEALVKSDYKIALLKDMNLATDRKKYEARMDKNLSIVWDKVLQLTVMDVPTALGAVMYSKTALLTDYITLYPVLKRNFEMDEICQLVEIDLYSNVKNYFITNRIFKYKEEFKIGSLRAKEAGLIKRILTLEKYKSFECAHETNNYKAQFEHFVNIIAVLLAAYILAVIILIGERIHYERNRVWPYVN
ncbi:unnamed protein product, partial [Brenthis ino]